MTRQSKNGDSMGLRDIEKKLKIRSAFQIKDAELMIKELEQMIENIKETKKQLEKFEKKYGKQVSENKEYYEKLSGLREELGLPKEIGRYDWKDAPSFRDRLTGGGYYDVLANDVLELGQSFVPENGGITTISELLTNLNKARPGKLVTIDDLYRALEKLIDTKLIPPFKILESGVKLVEFAPIEFSPDHDMILSHASKTGFVTKEQLIMKTGWGEERINRCLKFFEENHIARVDSSYAEGTKYWFPGLIA